MKHLRLKKAAFALAMLLMSVSAAKAGAVDMQAAKKIGAKYLSVSLGMKTEAQALACAKTYYMANGDAAFYVFNAARGFVIVAAQDVATPILGYSVENQFDANSIPENMEWWLQDYANQIQFGMETQNVGFEKTAKQWESVKTTGRLSENRNRSVVVPPLLGSIIWDQGRYYNNLCPEANAPTLGNHTYAGCVACAMSQIMRKWNHPAQGVGSHQLPPYDNPANVLDFSQTYYDWANMPVALTDEYGTLLDGITETQINAVATLMYHAGVSVSTTYRTSGSSADVDNPVGAFKNNFDYSDELEKEGLYSQDVAIWKAKLRSSLDHGYPVFYGGSSPSGAHAFVCDGYDSEGNFHINWGYSGNQNDYYAIGALNYGATGYNTQNYAIFNVHPSGTTTSFSVNLSTNNEHGAVTGSGNYNHGTSVTVHAEATTGGYYFCYWTEDGVIVSEDADYTFSITYNRNLEAVFMDSFTVEAETSNATHGTVSGGGTYGYNGSCTLTATANDGYIFENWTKNNEIVSCNNPYTFSVKTPGTYTAHFIPLEGQYIGDNNNTTSNAIPMNSLYKYSITEQIYTAAELGEAGDVNSIALYNVGYGSNLDDITRNLEIYIKPTDKTEFASTTDWIAGIEPEDLVFSGMVTFEYGTWTTINLDNTFAYNGTSNLVLIIVDGTGSTGHRHDFKTFATSDYTSLYKALDTEIDPNDMSGVTGSLRAQQKNKIIVNKSEHTGVYTVSASVNPSESGFVTDGSDNAFVSASFNDGDQCTLKANPNSSYVFRHWAKNGKIMSEDATYTFTVKSNVSLVAVFAAPSTVSVTINPANSGTVTGAGEYTYGSTCTLTATPAEGYAFNKWTIGGVSVSTNEEYSITVTEDVTVVANFRNADRIEFEDNAVKQTCLQNWDTNGDEELSIQEAVAVTVFDGGASPSLSYKFNYVNFTTFNELRFFTGLGSLGANAFSGNTHVTTVTLPNTITSIGNAAFRNCTNLSSIAIPNLVESIGQESFSGCTGLTYIVSECVTPPTLGSNCFQNVSTSIPVYVPKGSVAAYKAASGWSSFSKIVSVKTSNWSAPTATDAVYVDANYTLTDNVTVADVFFASEAYVLTIPEGKTLTVTGSIDASLASQIVVEDGGQLICNNAVQATVKKSIAAAANWGNETTYTPDNWYFIASPFNSLTSVTGLNTTGDAGDYDLYLYDGSKAEPWQNYKAHSIDFTFGNGKGYLYASEKGTTIEFNGTTKTYDATYGVPVVAGWNLVGNPYTFDAYASVSYYAMNAEGTGITANTVATSTSVKPCTGIVINAATGGTVKFFNEAPSGSANNGNIELILAETVTTRGGVSTLQQAQGSTTTIDNAIVSFNEGNRLEKFYFGSPAANIYIPRGTEEYAIVSAEAQGEMPINFRAAKDGEYTLTVNAENVEMNYLHLIDNLTGADIDLLAANGGDARIDSVESSICVSTYTFTAKTTDYASRFRLVFGAQQNGASTSSATFAFVCNGQIIVNGEGTVQVVDMTGRVMISKDGVRSISTVGLKPGVYMMRLIDANGTRVQKIVIE